MQHETQYYKAVKASERLPEFDERGTSEVVGIITSKGGKGIGVFIKPKEGAAMLLTDDGKIENKDFENVQWLEPIQLPDAAVLRDKMQEIAEATEGWKDGIGSVVNRIAREALSQTGDGWVRVEDGLPDKRIRVNVWDGLIVGEGYIDFDGDFKWSWPKPDVVYPITHWRPIPSPPKP